MLPALAQDRGGDPGPTGVRYSLGVGSRFEYTTNAGLDTPAEPRTIKASTRLSFAVADIAPNRELRLSAGLGLRAADGPGLSKTGVDEPTVRFSYALAGASSRLRTTAFWRRSEISFLRPLEDFTDDEGNIELPEDIGDLDGLGTRVNYGGTLSLRLGEESPVGFALDGDFRVIDYHDVTATNLFDSTRLKLSAATLLRFSTVDAGRVGVRYERYDAENLDDTLRQTYTAFVGYSRDLSETLKLDTELGYSEVDTQKLSGDTTTNGINGSIGLDMVLPNGTANADLTAQTRQDGTRLTFQLGRSLELPSGQLSGSLGATHAESGNWAPIGELVWRHDMPASRITARLQRRVAIASDDSTTLTTLASLNYNSRINDLSTFGVNLAYVAVDYDSSNPDSRRASISATYSRNLTEDWDMRFGLTYRSRERSGEDQADSKSVFVSLNRSFDW